jgi:hypothetical protein
VNAPKERFETGKTAIGAYDLNLNNKLAKHKMASANVGANLVFALWMGDYKRISPKNHSYHINLKNEQAVYRHV